MASDLFGKTSGPVRSMLWALAVRVILASGCVAPAALVVADSRGPGRWAGYILMATVVWIDVMSIATIVLIVRKHVAGKILGWIVFAELIAGIPLSIAQMKTQPMSFISIAGGMIFGGIIFMGLISHELKVYYMTDKEPGGFPVTGLDADPAATSTAPLQHLVQQKCEACGQGFFAEPEEVENGEAECPNCPQNH